MRYDEADGIALCKMQMMFYFFPSLLPPGVSESPGTSLPAPVVMVMPAHSGRGWVRGGGGAGGLWLAEHLRNPPSQPSLPPSLFFFLSRLCDERLFFLQLNWL